MKKLLVPLDQPLKVGSEFILDKKFVSIVESGRIFCKVKNADGQVWTVMINRLEKVD